MNVDLTAKLSKTFLKYIEMQHISDITRNLGNIPI